MAKDIKNETNKKRTVKDQFYRSNAKFDCLNFE